MDTVNYKIRIIRVVHVQRVKGFYDLRKRTLNERIKIVRFRSVQKVYWGGEYGVRGNQVSHANLFKLCEQKCQVYRRLHLSDQNILKTLQTFTILRIIRMKCTKYNIVIGQKFDTDI